MSARLSAARVGLLALLGVAVLASSSLLRRERTEAPPPRGTDDLLTRIYA